jgi:hypothetical protein
MRLFKILFFLKTLIMFKKCQLRSPKYFSIKFFNSLYTSSIFISRGEKKLAFSYKNFFTSFKFRKSKGEIIIHPELGGERIECEWDKSFKYQNKSDINSQYIDEDKFSKDYDLSFISLDKNGIPIIKKTYYESLGVKTTASSREIKSNYLQIAKKFHPDIFPDALVLFILQI